MGKGKEVEAKVATTEKKFMGGSSSKNKVGLSQMKKNGKGKTPKNSKGNKVAKGLRTKTPLKLVHSNLYGSMTVKVQECSKLLLQSKASSLPENHEQGQPPSWPTNLRTKNGVVGLDFVMYTLESKEGGVFRLAPYVRSYPLGLIPEMRCLLGKRC
ncbi:gag/pol protein [Cucumis melo var. makuwa]|uniref:Gag/pol protein n=1 Tax=Cucumis melo var. makuwa TaxID=1194695 RepID=A0A5A7TLB7_CUCMM|nr:gag/pol protein [Cucumis melo var. makuwa]TYK09737.1 gag/pol protein [Cucumis melo var. makuwa]